MHHLLRTMYTGFRPQGLEPRGLGSRLTVQHPAVVGPVNFPSQMHLFPRTAGRTPDSFLRRSPRCLQAWKQVFSPVPLFLGRIERER